MRIAALDYGEKRVGVAVANTELGIPLPAGILPNDMEQIVNWLQKENIECVVVGAPYLLWGEKGERVQEIEQFAESLRQRSGIPVELLDERLTTMEAERRLRESNPRIDKRKQAVDAVAAALLLETYLRRLGI